MVALSAAHEKGDHAGLRNQCGQAVARTAARGAAAITDAYDERWVDRLVLAKRSPLTPRKAAWYPKSSISQPSAQEDFQ